MKKLFLFLFSFWIVFFLIFSTFAFDEVIVFDLKSCELKGTVRGLPTIVSDPLSIYTVRFKSESDEIIIGVNSLERRVYFPLDYKFTVEILEGVNVLCNKTFIISLIETSDSNILEKFFEEKAKKREKVNTSIFFILSLILIILLIYSFYLFRRHRRERK
ncbi:MAG: hypothetical protein QXD62_02735 [Candidatus Woesearchaeota archaeon]